MGRIILVTGGSRSGKSTYAQHLAESLPGPRAFVATCPVIDNEMDERIRKHRAARADHDWDTIEETLSLADALTAEPRYGVYLVDCLTLWINNLMYAAELAGGTVTEDGIAEVSQDLTETCRQIDGTVILVTNEVGMGIVPDNALSRRYRDLVGRCNQTIAAEADEVVLVTCGIPLVLKSV